MGSKKWWSLLTVVLFCALLGGCKNVEVAPVVALQDVWTEHKMTEYINAYTLDEEGNLYTLEWDMTANEGQSDRMQEALAGLTAEEIAQMTPEELEALMPEEEDAHFLRKYNAQGERIFSKALDSSATSYVITMAVQDGTVYFVSYITGREKATLHSYCLETEELTVVKELPYLKSVLRIIPMGDCLYLLGTNVEGYFGLTDSRKYMHSGQKIFCYTVSEDKLEELGIEEPMDICAAEEGKLCIYAHMGEEFGLLLYDTERDAMTVLAKTEEYKMQYVAYCSEQQAVMYMSLGRGLVLSYFTDLDVECELYPDFGFQDNNICCVNGNVAVKTSAGNTIIQFPVAQVKCENKSLRYIRPEIWGLDPFGCGYEIQCTELTQDKFALKVMALDKDFDLCYVNSYGSFGYSMKEYGVFYPLNNIPRIQEYLDACFPYVKEAATDIDGNIWMIPIAVDIPGIVVKKDATEDVLFKENMTYEKYCREYEALSPEEKKWAIAPDYYAVKFINQYILDRGTIDTEEFRNILQSMAKSSGAEQENTEAMYCRVWEERDYRAYGTLEYGEDATVFAEPKLKADNKNVGTCQFLAVNPYSDNLEETLQYITTLVAYMLEKEDAPLFFANREVADTNYERTLYELYENGAIAFSVDEDVYEGYEDVLDGSLTVEDFVKEAESGVKIYLNE